VANLRAHYNSKQVACRALLLGPVSFIVALWLAGREPSALPTLSERKLLKTAAFDASGHAIMHSADGDKVRPDPCCGVCCLSYP
jgi:hypothetical protein